jgi:hypothetical protein
MQVKNFETMQQAAFSPVCRAVFQDTTVSRANFEVLMGELTDFVAQQPLDAALAEKLNRERGPASPQFRSIEKACRDAVADGWMCDREAGGIAYGRVLKPAPALHGFSVDVVDMRDVAGPHHTHPQGEIDLVMPQDGAPRFDGHGAGWVVYGPGAAHRPTVTGGRALVLYLLPAGAIEFTRAAA